jgi:hypothetical protein
MVDAFNEAKSGAMNRLLRSPDRYFACGGTNVDTVGEFRLLGIVILIRAPPFAGNDDSRSSLSRVFSVFVLISPIRL